VKDKNWLKDLAYYSSWGFDFAASVLVFTYLGYWLDKKYSTRPWLTVAGALLGVFIGYYSFWVSLKKNEQKGKKKIK